MVSLSDKYALLGQHAQADMMRAQADDMRARAMNSNAYHERMAAQNPQNIAMAQEQMRAKTYGMQADARNTDATANRTTGLLPYEQQKMGADAYHTRAQGDATYGKLPYEQEKLASEAYGNRTIGYLAERRGTPPGVATQTDPRSLAYGGMPAGPRTVSVGGGMATGDGTYSPSYRTVSAPSGGAPAGYTREADGSLSPLPGADGMYRTSSGAAYPPRGAGATRPQPRSKPKPLAGPDDAFGDNDPMLSTKPTSLNSTAGLVSGFSDPFAARGMTNFSGQQGLLSNPRVRAGTGIYSAPSSSFTSMVGRDSAMSAANQKDPITGQSYGMVPSYDNMGWENPANKRY